MSEEPVFKTVAELRIALAALPPTARVYTEHPPFLGVRIVQQGESSFLICAPRAERVSAP